MRRLLILPAIALVLLASPVLATESTTPPPASTDEVAVAPAGQTVSEGFTSAPMPTDAQMVGVTWDGDARTEFTIEVQDKHGNWSPAPDIKAEGGAEEGSKDAARQAASPDNGSEPVWLGNDALAVRVRVTSGDAQNLELVNVDAESNAPPGGSAGAAAGILPIVDGPGRYLFAAVMLALAALLIAFALGWSPWRRRRVRALGAAFALALLCGACVPSTPSDGSGSSSIPNGDVWPQMTFRSQWGARNYACGTPDYAPKLQFAVIHHTVNGNTYSASESPAMVRGIQAYHMDALGYCDIAYNFLVDRFGQIFVGRAGGPNKPVIGGHAGGFNTSSTGVALLGDYTSASVPTAQMNALIHLLRWRLSVGFVDPSQGFWFMVKTSPCNCQRWAPGTWVHFDNAILTHRDVDYTECPGNGVYTKLASIRTQVKAGIVFPPTTTTSTTAPAVKAGSSAPPSTAPPTTAPPTTVPPTTAPAPSTTTTTPH